MAAVKVSVVALEQSGIVFRQLCKSAQSNQERSSLKAKAKRPGIFTSKTVSSFSSMALPAGLTALLRLEVPHYARLALYLQAGTIVAAAFVLPWSQPDK
jgi:hypothetical protein